MDQATLTLAQLLLVMPKCPTLRAGVYLPFLNQALAEADINTPARMAAFLATIAVESGQLRYFQEIWGPTDQQKKYEPPNTLAKQLGNTERGDGKKYLGRGAIQVTGKFGYGECSKVLGVDFLGNPELLAQPEHAFRSAAVYFWQSRKLNALADRMDFEGITKKVNGGLTGLEERERFYKIALQVLMPEMNRSSVA